MKSIRPPSGRRIFRFAVRSSRDIRRDVDDDSFVLREVMPLALAFLLVAVLYAVVGYVLYVRARTQAARVEPIPQTVGSLKENLT